MIPTAPKLSNSISQKNKNTMKTIGFLGGMTYQSTALYYNLINNHIQRHLGGPACAAFLLHSFNMAEMSALFSANRWDAVTDEFTTAAINLKKSGANGLALGCNIGHKVAEEVERRSGLPLLHIADFAAAEIKPRRWSKIALLATQPAMEEEFIKGRLKEKAGVEILIPGKDDREAVNAAIFSEINAGIVTEKTRTFMIDLVRRLVDEGAQGVVLACTDLQFVLKQEDVSVPLLDTMELHAKGIAEWALDD